MPETASIEERVAAGAAWLDRNHHNWVNPGAEDDYLTTDETKALGFYAGAAASETGRRDYPLLTAEWTRLILSRREAVSGDA